MNAITNFAKNTRVRFGPVLRAWPVVVALGLFASCMPPMGAADSSRTAKQRVNSDTDWIRHIKPPRVLRSRVDARRLVSELALDIPPATGYVPPEQIAAYAIQELREGHDLDAAVLLSLASYRYTQQAKVAYLAGQHQADHGVTTARGSFTIPVHRREKFMDLVVEEAKFFYAREFNDELDLVRDHLFGVPQARARGAAYIASLAQGGERVEDIGDQLNRYRLSLSNRPERLTYPQIADAYRERLIADRYHEHSAGTAAMFLARTPLDSFRRAALADPYWMFDAALVKNVLPRMHTLRNEVRQQLWSANAKSRSNAAILLGLAPEPDDLEMLREVAELENDEQVSASLTFALIRHGDGALVDELVRLARTASGETRQHALAMILWLPDADKTSLEEATLVALAGDDSSGPHAQGMALTIIRAIAEKRALTRNTVQAVVRLTSARDESVAEDANDALARFSQLSAEQCKDLYRRHRSARIGLLERLGQIASMTDLDFLAKVHDEARALRTENPEQASALMVALALAVARIPGTASTQLLVRWFEMASETDAMVLAALLSTRTDRKAINAGSLPLAKRLMLELAFDGPELGTTLVRQVERLDIQSTALIARMAGALERQAARNGLWNLASYRHDDRYPVDALVRNIALASLVRLELTSRSEDNRERPSSYARK